ncbi:hypothetical protein GJAV_G00240840 [Gymnothorax javanicus]|nr:hypothetical protein GJAV_G00240840 [Gymnothorax javanicus]
MAARPSSLEDDLTCPVCCDVFRDPVILKCSHSFCRECLSTYWMDKSVNDCPSCRRRSSTDQPPANLSLRNIVEFYQKKQSKNRGKTTSPVVRGKGHGANVRPQRSEGETAMGVEASGTASHLCSQHGEKLQFFCSNDQEPICVVCQQSRKHRGHDLSPIDEAVQDLKVEVKKGLKPLREKLGTFLKMKEQCLKMADHIQSQARQTECQIRKTFEELRHFLQLEESRRIAALMNETELKSVIMREKIDHLSLKMTSLSDTIRDIENEIEADDVSFLKAYKQTKGRTNFTLQDPEPVQRALIDVVTHLGSLKFKVWEKMMDTVQYTPVTLDPNTAAGWLAVSNDLAEISYQGKQPQIPDNPERCKDGVLGAEGFVDGRHTWEVEVGNKSHWDIGVVKESVCRKSFADTDATQGYWALAFRDGKLYKAGTQFLIPLSLKKNPQRIKVLLDYENGQVSFFEQSDASHIHTFKDRFTEKLFPYFSPCMSENSEPLKICPTSVSIVK